ncbi:MAG TPA: type II toxin-antitoxin system VapC family toxin [Terriglobales bacterium]|nr:type II toxin-antitoxin system VapC family toxin [Terriglobales bacterium]
MKRYLLDTNVVSELRNNKPHGAVVTWIASLREEQKLLCASTIGELQIGVEITRRQDAAKAHELETWVNELCHNSQIISMDTLCFREWGRLMYRKSGQLAQDALIAATARVHGFVVATRNEADFKNFEVEIFNPFKLPKS